MLVCNSQAIDQTDCLLINVIVFTAKMKFMS